MDPSQKYWIMDPGEEGLAQNFNIFNTDLHLARQYYSYMTRQLRQQRLEYSLELLPSVSDGFPDRWVDDSSEENEHTGANKVAEEVIPIPLSVGLVMALQQPAKSQVFTADAAWFRDECDTLAYLDKSLGFVNGPGGLKTTSVFVAIGTQEPVFGC
ncbi:hypothetical protein CONLIGDRAFT_687761 [Coniochaeta ligniaria NRRL 30616]|uniref:Uncharacterized protein n=1 Tax=Coniochaeta ligniaria NRRL 30616 TaxID=1408157 RepID=A0A1J7I3V1_9PEZI|nr:hypothetical protein CONLIGDRAFT_687761 [Coniochaeta ligniaria NRRL 30616]